MSKAPPAIYLSSEIAEEMTKGRVFATVSSIPSGLMEEVTYVLGSDNPHTMEELYEHRHRLFLTLVAALPELSWASKTHSDGSSYEGWFICGMNLPSGQISYHLPDRFWSEVTVLGIHRNEQPIWDGHSSDNVLDRLKDFHFTRMSL